MKKVLVLGAGLVAPAHVRYLLEHGFEVTVVDQDRDRAELVICGHTGGRAQCLDIETNRDGLDQLVAEHDLAVSLLPYAYHPRVAEACIRHQKHMVTASYVTDEMRALDGAAREAGVTILNEVGVDPGIDHMMAIDVIRRVQKTGEIVSFVSYCGGLPAPDANDNPFGYKFSWSPKGVLLAGKNSARFRWGGELVEIPGESLFEHHWPVQIRIGEDELELEGYPNRDSFPYEGYYGIQPRDAMFRGTLRYPGWCDALKALAGLGMLDEEPKTDIANLTFAQFTSQLVGRTNGSDLTEAVARHLGVEGDSHVVSNLEWLGLFGNDPLPNDAVSPIDVLTATMLEKMQYAPNERDMLVLQHQFVAQYPDRIERITATMIDYGIPGGDSSMARTVGLPAAVGVRLILEGAFAETGVLVPVQPAIYEPMLKELEKLGIEFHEETEVMS